ncbi:MFS transporter [Sphingorhabdus contaminans]|uniref:MFS transporter n=1 Tax=Sphingorhabdus contaminans TaxID=1343899 RepID=A0A553WCB6_9SPHN|nr:MFS transporter [Sphingorhabdus contaminans]TSB02323.1 MFS transporter [Sphingorhabdus contaminans]
MTLSVLDRNLLSLLVIPIQADLGFSEIQMGALMGIAFGLFFCLGALPIGWALDRYSRPLVIWAGVTVWSIGTMACGMAQNFWSFFAARATIGAGEAVLGPGSQSLLSDYFPPKRLALPMAVYSTGIKIGAGVSLAIGGALTLLISPDTSYDVMGLVTLRGWQAIFLIVGAPGLLIAFLAFTIRDPRISSCDKVHKVGYADYFKVVKANWRFVVPHHLGLVLVGMVAVGLQAWMPVFFERVHGLSTAQIGPSLGLAISVGTVVGLPLHGKIVDFWFSRGVTDAHLRYVAITTMIATIVAVAIFAVPDPGHSLFLVGLYFLIISGYLSLPVTILQIITPIEMRGKAASLLVAINGVIALGGAPLLVATVTDALGGGQAIGESLLLCSLSILPLSALAFWLALPSVRSLMASRTST